MVYIPQHLALRSVLPSLIYNAIDQDPEKAIMSDAQIIHRAKPDSIDWELRIRMARIIGQAESEAERNAKDDTIWTEGDFCRGICNRDALRLRLEDEWKRDFLVRPLHTFKQATDNIIKAVTARLYEISSIPIMYDALGPKGEIVQRVDHKNAKLVMDLAKLMLDRKLGSAIQRQVTMTAAVPGATLIATPAEVEQKIKALEAEFEDKPRNVSRGTSGEKAAEGTTAVSSERGSDGV